MSLGKRIHRYSGLSPVEPLPVEPLRIRFILRPTRNMSALPQYVRKVLMGSIINEDCLHHFVSCLTQTGRDLSQSSIASAENPLS